MNAQINRFSLIWLLLAQAIIVLPHIFRTPAVLLPLSLFCVVYLIQIYKSRWRMPNQWVKALFVIVSFSLVYWVERRIFSMDGMVLLLIMAFFLKLLELKAKRDLLIAIYLAYFVIATQMLFEQDLISALYLIACLLLVTAALISTYIQVQQLPKSYPLKVAAQMLAVSLPIMLLAFLVFPRLPPLWAMPLPSDKGKTGMSDFMQPGSIAELAESDELVFRSEFATQTPPLSDLYWRGVVLEQYDGKQWKEAKTEAVDDVSLAYNMDAAQQYDYQITLEPHQKRWLFALEGVQSFPHKARLQNDYTLQSRRPIYQREQWQLSSALGALKVLPLSSKQRRINTYLPAEQNPRMQALAQQWWQENPQPEAYLDAVLQHFNQQDFYYTMSPNLLGEHAVDEFLFDSRRGFCEHYTHAFVSLARSVGLPARVIMGYQGGDINPYKQHVTVRQLDAHAWAEVWLENQGWVRFDPTFAVAPERIERGSRDSLSQEERYLAKSPLSAVRFGGVVWLSRFQYRFDQMNYWWHSTVLAYQGEQQNSLLQHVLGKDIWLKIAIFIVTTLFLTILLVVALLHWRYRPAKKPAQLKLYHQFVRKLAKQGVEKPSNMAAQAFAQLAAEQLPEKAEAIQAVTASYLTLQYAELTQEQRKRQLLQLKQAVQQFH